MNAMKLKETQRMSNEPKTHRPLAQEGTQLRGEIGLLLIVLLMGLVHVLRELSTASFAVAIGQG